MEYLTGSCFCGEVTFKLEQEIQKVVNCHCTRCRKRNGSAFSTYAATAKEGLTILSGKPARFNISEHTAKNFCGKCGTPIYNENENLPGMAIVYVGALDTQEPLTPQANIFCDTELEWLSTLGELPRVEKPF